MNIDKFIIEQGLDSLIEKGILIGKNNLLKGRSVAPLLELMKTKNISILTSSDENWSLDIKGDFRNTGSDERRSGNIEDITKLGNVFKRQNININPFFKAADNDNKNENPLILSELRKVRLNLLHSLQQIDEIEKKLMK